MLLAALVAPCEAGSCECFVVNCDDADTSKAGNYGYNKDCVVEVVGDLNPFKRDLVVPGTEILIRPLRRLALQDGTGPILIIGPRLARDSTEMQAQFRRAGRPVLLAAP